MITVVSQQLLTSAEKRDFAKNFNSKLTYPVAFNYCTLDQFTGGKMTVLYGFNTEETREFCSKYPESEVITLATSNSLGRAYNRVLYCSIGCDFGDISECFITNERIVDDYKQYLRSGELLEATEIGADELNEFQTDMVQIKNNRSEKDTIIVGIGGLYEIAKERPQEVFLTTQLNYDADQDTPNVFMTGAINPELVTVDTTSFPINGFGSFYKLKSKSTGKVLGVTPATVLASNGYLFQGHGLIFPVYNLAGAMGEYAGNTYASFFDLLPAL